MKILDVNFKEHSAVVQDKGRLDSGRGKERIVMFGVRTRTATHQYLLSRSGCSANARLFMTNDGRQTNRWHLSTHLRRMGKRANVQKCHAHRVRPTFAIMFLRNGEDIYTLQRLLEHCSLEMANRYLSIAQTDIEAAHRRAGLVDNLLL